jgi:hypothetical protein
MKSSRLTRLKHLLVAMLAVFAFGAITAASAAAETKGPFWTVEKAKLEKNETREIFVKAYEGTASPIRLEAELLTVKAKVECHLASVAKGSFIAGGVPGTAHEVAEFKDCTTTNNGAECKVVEPIVTEPIVAQLVVSDEEGHFGNSILVEFDPAAGTTALFVVLKFTGEHCVVASTEVGKGLVVGSSYTDETTPKPVSTIGTPEATSGLLKFPDAAKSVWLLLPSETWSLLTITPFKAFGNEAKLTGTVLVSLASGKKYGEEV